LKIKKRGRKEGVSEEKKGVIEGLREEIRKGKSTLLPRFLGEKLVSL